MIDRARVMSLLAELGWTQATLARALNVTPSAIQQILSGKTKNSRLIPHLAEALGVQAPYIEGLTDDRSAANDTMTATQLSVLLDKELPSVSPTWTDQILGDGNPKRAVLNLIHDPYWIRSQVARVSPELFEEFGPHYQPPIIVSFMTNDAMSPTLKKGDQLLVSTSSRRVIGDEGLWAINYGGSNLVRRLMPLPRGEGYRVSADNPSAPSFEASTEDIQLRGLVFWCGRMLS